MRIPFLSGSAGAGGGGATASASCTGSRGGGGGADRGVAQPVSKSAISSQPTFKRLITETNSHDVDFRGAQPASRYVEFIQILNRTHIDAIVITLIHFGPLYPRLDAV